MSAVERRAHPRRRADFEARVANVSEAVPPAVRVVDISRGGALLRYDEPVGLHTDERIVVSLAPSDTAVMLLARVVRVARGTDFRTYVAVQFDDDQADELELLERQLADLGGELEPDRRNSVPLTQLGSWASRSFAAARIALYAARASPPPVDTRRTPTPASAATSGTAGSLSTLIGRSTARTTAAIWSRSTRPGA